MLGCTTPLRCAPSEVAPLGPAGFGFCGAADVSALGAAAAGGGRGKSGTCGTACIVGVVVGSAALAALLASLGWCAARPDPPRPDDGLLAKAGMGGLTAMGNMMHACAWGMGCDPTL